MFSYWFRKVSYGFCCCLTRDGFLCVLNVFYCFSYCFLYVFAIVFYCFSDPADHQGFESYPHPHLMVLWVVFSAVILLVVFHRNPPDGVHVEGGVRSVEGTSAEDQKK